MTIDRDKFFDAVREDPFGGNLTQRQVDGLNFLLDVWAQHFNQVNLRDSIMFLAYELATVFHETAQTMEPIEEYGEGSGRDYGQPVGPYGQCYYGRGYPQLTWEDNYKKGEERLAAIYGVAVPLHRYPHRMLEHETSALVLYDGMMEGWFTGVGLPQFFDSVNKIEDPYNARKTVNALDKAGVIEGYYWAFKSALT
jgi:putative chitinase